MIFEPLRLYLSLCLVSVTVHISEPRPTMKNPKAYDLAGCSGVFIGPNMVLTAGHCVKESRGHQWIKTNDSKSYTAIIDKKDYNKDLAILTIPSIKQHEFASLGEPLNITERLYTVNTGAGYEQSYNEGIVNNIFEDEETGTLMVMHNATIFEGASGSGIFDRRGRLVGINTVTLHSLVGAVDLTEIQQFLKKR